MPGEIAIIGGGIGGLAAAVRLQDAGFRVTIYEKNLRTGGKLSSRVTEGGYVDLGPTLLTMIPVFDELFASVGGDFRSSVPLHPIDPTCRYRWSDGTTFNAWGNARRLLEETARVFPEDVENLERFLRETAEVYEATREIFLERPFRGLRELLTIANVRLLPLLGRLGFTSTMHRALSSRFQSPKLVQLLGRFATYNGSSPYTAPATLNVIAHVELSLGSWYPVGGMQSLADAITSLARDVGVRIETDAEVTAVMLDGSRRRVTGLSVNGIDVPADVVVSNVDALHTWRELLQPAGVRPPRRLAGDARSCSGFLVTGSADRPTEGGGLATDRAHHTIYFADDYRREFDDIFDRREYPDPMTIYRSIPSVTDPDLAEGGREGWYLLVNVPSGQVPVDPAAYTGRILDRLREFEGSTGLAEIETMGPAEIERWYGSAGGAIYGASSNSIFSAFLRHGNRTPELENFYFVGGSVHPGGGLPLVALSGRIVSTIIIDRHGV